MDAALTAHRRVTDAAAALLRDLERAVEGETGMATASRVLAALNDHIEPLRDAVSDAEFADELAALARDLEASAGSAPQ